MIVKKKDSTFELKIAYFEYKNGVFYGTVEAKNLDCDPDVKQVNFSYSEDSKVFLIPFIDSDYNRKWLEGKYEHYVRANDFLTKFSKEIEKFITDSYEARIRNDEFTIKKLAEVIRWIYLLRSIHMVMVMSTRMEKASSALLYQMK